MDEKRKKMILELDDPINCADCPCLSGYGHRCQAANMPFDKKELHGYLGNYPLPYKPYWCPLEEVEE